MTVAAEAPPASTPARTSSDRPTTISVTGRHCRCRTCGECGKTYGGKVRQRLLAQAGEWKMPLMLSLTVDRNDAKTGRGYCFASPKDAHQYVTAGRYIAQLMRRLGVKRWVWVLEFQMETGDGWPHWHVLLDLGDLPTRRLDFKQAWHLWRDTWKIGGLDFSTRFLRDGRGDAQHAILYITKYLTKHPQDGYPEWVLHHAKMVRFVGACKLVGPLVGNAGSAADTGEDGDEREHRPLLERMAECGQSCDLWAEVVDPETGEVAHRWAGSIPLPRHEVEVAAMLTLGDRGGREVSTRTYTNHDGFAATVSVARFTVARATADDIRRAVARLVPDPLGRHDALVADVRLKLLDDLRLTEALREARRCGF